MSLSARNVAKNEVLLQKIKNYENDLSKLKATIRKTEATVSATVDRDKLFDGMVPLVPAPNYLIPKI